MGAFAALTILALPLEANAQQSLYQRRARAYSEQQEALGLDARSQTIARINRYYDSVESRFMLNLANFGRAFSGFASAPQCYDRNVSDGHAYGSRQLCGSGLCVNVLGSGPQDSSERSDISVESFRKYASPSYCDATLNNGYACRVSYIHSPKDGWMTALGGSCIDGQGQARELKVPFKNIKFN